MQAIDGVDAAAWSRLGDTLNASVLSISSLPVASQLERFSDVEGELKYGLGALLWSRDGLLATVHAYDCTKNEVGNSMYRGDLLIGFAALEVDTPAFELEVCGTRHATLAVPALRRGEWHVALGGRFPIPMLVLGTQPRVVAHTLPPGCWTVYAHLDGKLRKALRRDGAAAQLSRAVSWEFFDGHGGISAASGASRVPLPALEAAPPPLAAMMARARERMDVLREDMARAAWHPRRMRRWCLAHNDLFFGGAGGASPPADPE